MNDNRGFTLIEILVVVLIIGITLGFAVLAFGDFGRSRQMDVAGEQLVQYLKLIEQQALLEGNYYRVNVDQSGYRFTHFAPPAQWVAPKVTLLRPQLFPKDSTLSFSGLAGGQHTQGVIDIDPSGAITPFKLILGSTQRTHQVLIQGTNDGLSSTQYDAQ